MFLFKLFKRFKMNSLNLNRCPFCKQELELSDTTYEKGRLLQGAYDEMVLCVNSRGQLGVKKYKHEEEYAIISHHLMFCPKHKYQLLYTSSSRDENGEGDDSDTVYEVTHSDYEFISAGNLNNRQVKKLKSHCKSASRDILRRCKY